MSGILSLFANYLNISLNKSIKSGRKNYLFSVVEIECFKLHLKYKNSSGTYMLIKKQ